MKANSRAIAYLATAFAISWTAISIVWINGARTLLDAGSASSLFTFGPPIAALGCAFVFDKGHRLRALGLVFKPNRWWLVALFLPAAMTVYHTVLLRIFLGPDAARIWKPQKTIAAMFQLRPETLPDGSVAVLAIAALIAFGFSILFTLTEEIGWRGYLYRQWRPLGFWRYSLLTGLVWGVWHWPMVIYFGLIFNDNRLAGLLFYPLSTMAIAPIMTLLRDRAGSVWAPGIYHGMHNMIGIVFFGALVQPDDSKFSLLPIFLPPLLLVELFRRTWPRRRGDLGLTEPDTTMVVSVRAE